MPNFQPALLKSYFDFINERHHIYLRRQAGQPWPWTQDKILQTYRFCEVFRELDKVTIWIRKNWREPYANHRNLWFAMCIARQINWPPTLEAIGFPTTWNAERVYSILKDLARQRKKIYTGAYMLTGTLGGSKMSQTAFKILDPLYRNPPPLYRAKSLEEAFNMLKGRPGFGAFMAYEVVTDLRWTRYLKDAPDIMTWANAGPGAKRGVYRLMGMSHSRYDRDHNLSPSEHLEAMVELLKLSPQYLGDHVPPLELREIEHQLCEWDKHQRITLGQGKMRSRYQPPGLLG